MERGGAIGRFAHLLGERCIDDLKSFYEEEALIEKNALICGLAFIPRTERVANVATHPCLRPHYLETEKTKSYPIHMDDIFVGSTGDGFFLTTKCKTHEIIGRFDHVVNTSLAPDILQFIHAVSISRYSIPKEIRYWEVEDTAIFLPRIVYKNLILSPSRWNFESVLFDKVKQSQLATAFEKLADQWSLPKKVIINHRDQKLLIDRTHPGQFALILQILKKQETLKFEEDFDSYFATSQDGCHNIEFVVPFLRNKKEISAIPHLYHEERDEKNRRKLPGSDWSSWHLYLIKDDNDTFLVENLSPLLASLLKKNLIEKWFFIRYADPQNHIRFRVQFPTHEDNAPALSIIQTSINNWLHELVIKDVKSAVYERELERYGGAEHIDLTETLFCLDSFAAVKTLHGLAVDNSMDKTLLATLSGYIFLKEFALTSEDITKVCVGGKTRSIHLKGIRSVKEAFLESVSNIHAQNNSNNYLNVLLHYQKEKKSSVNEFLQKTNQLSQGKRLDIINSLLHMHFNRFGLSPNEEAVIRAYIANLVKQLGYKNFSNCAI